jgi:hypothetical protein
MNKWLFGNPAKIAKLWQFGYITSATGAHLLEQNAVPRAPSHGENRGSSPLGSANKIRHFSHYQSDRKGLNQKSTKNRAIIGQHDRSSCQP